MMDKGPKCETSCKNEIDMDIFVSFSPYKLKTLFMAIQSLRRREQSKPKYKSLGHDNCFMHDLVLILIHNCSNYDYVRRRESSDPGCLLLTGIKLNPIMNK